MSNLHFYLQSIPSHNLLDILKKVDNVVLVRMRQTCSFMDLFVEENRFSLSFRKTNQLKIGIQKHHDWDGIIVKKYKKNSTLGSFSYYFPARKVNQRLSAISIRTIHVHLSCETKSNKDLRKLLYFLNLVCDDLEIETFCETKEILEIAEDFQWKNIKFTLHERRNNIRTEYSSKLRETLTIFQKSPLHQQFSINYKAWERIVDENLFGLVKDFKIFEIDGYNINPLFCNFIQDLFNSNGDFSLKRVCFRKMRWEPPVHPIYPIRSKSDHLSFKTLYKANVQGGERVFYQIERNSQIRPTLVRKLELGHKLVFCIENSQMHEILIFGRNIEIADASVCEADGMKVLEIFSTKEFLEASDERQIEILKDTFGRP